MRLIALSIVILAGAVMASAGVIADALPNARQFSQLPVCGLLLVGAGCVLFAIEWWSGRSRDTGAPSDTALPVGVV
jgi:hypothetical protein